MKKIKIFFIISLFILLGTISVCIFDLPENNFSNLSSNITSEAVARPVYINEEISPSITSEPVAKSTSKQTSNLHGVTKKLLIILGLTIIFPVIIALLLLKKFNMLVNNADNSTAKTVQETVDKLKELQDKFNDTFDVNNIEQNSQKLVKELNDFMSELSQEELENGEIKPIKKQESKPQAKYVQKEKTYTKPKLHEPLLISQQAISKTKGFYLVDCGKDKALVGYINDDIFLLNRFQKIQNASIQVRFTERIGKRNIYMVKNGSYKALVQVEKENMKVLLEM